jgi:hypothetical protein
MSEAQRLNQPSSTAATSSTGWFPDGQRSLKQTIPGTSHNRVSPCDLIQSLPNDPMSAHDQQTGRETLHQAPEVRGMDSSTAKKGTARDARVNPPDRPPSETCSSGAESHTQSVVSSPMGATAMAWIRRSLAVAAAFALATSLSPSTTAAASSSEYNRQSVSCQANENLWEMADFFISRCRKSSVRREFPSQLLYESLRQIKNGSTASHRKAWKLLNDGRFLK